MASDAVSQVSEQWPLLGLMGTAAATLFSYLIIELRRGRDRAERLADEERKRSIDAAAEYLTDIRKTTAVLTEMTTALREQREVLKGFSDEFRAIRIVLEAMGRRRDEGRYGAQ